MPTISNKAWKAWKKANPEKHAANQKKWQKKNKEKYAAYVRTWRAANPDKVKYWASKYRAQKLKAYPRWLSPGMKEAIKYKYETAQKLTEKTGILHEVDHIIPLRGKTVCGLHVPWNLQVLTKEENMTKSNRMI